ncbi:Hypothetical predicted protein [Lecanosticta acicola]|uniref:Uncharacterized protein n=1 Tax=Lecanosticta acicola TaxID=111012 RepID=A0AAI8Z1D0_9PEZI|nr:Hypothetical predicted protein [Lecanosticta acicola]
MDNSTRPPRRPDGESTAPDATSNSPAQARPDARQTPQQPTSQSYPPPHSTSRNPRQKPMSNYNIFHTTCSVSTDQPPSFAMAMRPRPTPSSLEGRERLPDYSCTVEFGAKVLLNLESLHPLSHVGGGDWRELYALVRGTMLNLHRVKDGGAGKLLRSYTLQHAEVGLASDVEFAKLVPQTRLAHLIPQGARRRAWQKDATLFREMRQTVLRLRAETHQLLLAGSEEQPIWSLVHALSAAIDIAQPIDDRSIARQCTVPRRRRRHQQHRATNHAGVNINDPAMLAEQERIFSQMFPRFAERRREEMTQDQSALQSETPAQAVEQAPPSPLLREEEEIDLTDMREDSARPQSSDGTIRPGAMRTNTTDTMYSAFSEDMIHVTSPANFTPEGKWQPAQTRTAAQLQRYIRRCMPVLLADAPRASDIVIYEGRRMRINARMELLEDWELQPPPYKAHNFHQESGLVRSVSQRSATGSANPAAPQSSSSVLASEDDPITQAEQTLDHQRLSKITTVSTMDKSAPSRATLQAMADVDAKGRSPAQIAQDSSTIQGVMWCF